MQRGKRISITFTDEKIEVIEKISANEYPLLADTVRKLCDEASNFIASSHNIDLVTKIIDERLASLSAKGAIMSATFLNAQALADFVLVENQRDLVETYEKIRFKGVAYVKGRVSESEEEVQEAIKKEVRKIDK